MNKCVLMLPEVARRWIWEKKGFDSIYEFAGKLAGMSRNKVNEGLRILEKTREMPKIRGVIEKKGVWAVKPVIRVANAETQEFWAKKAMNMSKRVLETYVNDVIKQEEKGRPGAAESKVDILNKPNQFEKTEENNEPERAGRPKQFERIEIKLKPETAARLLEAKGKEDWEELMTEFLEYKELKEKEFKERLEREKSEIIKTHSHTVPVAINKYVKLRAKGYCEMPDCNSKGEHLHHTIPFALKKEHGPDKIRLLCEARHAIEHYGLIGKEEAAKKMANP